MDILFKELTIIILCGTLIQSSLYQKYFNCEIYRFINHLCLIDLVVQKVVHDQDLAQEVAQIKSLLQELAEEQVAKT